MQLASCQMPQSDEVLQQCWLHAGWLHEVAQFISKTSYFIARFFDVRSRKQSAALATPAANLSLCWSPDGHYMAVGNKEDLVCIVDCRQMKIMHKYPNKLQVLLGSVLSGMSGAGSHGHP